VKPSRTRSGKAANEEPAVVLSERTTVEDLHGILLDRHHEGEGDTRGSWRTRGRVLGPPDLDLVLRWGSLHERWHRGDGSGGRGRDACGRVGVVGVVLGRRGIDGELLLHRQRRGSVGGGRLVVTLLHGVYGLPELSAPVVGHDVSIVGELLLLRW
jgi:hypothetical protein